MVVGALRVFHFPTIRSIDKFSIYFSHHGLVAPDEPAASEPDLSEVVQRASAGCLIIVPDGPAVELRRRALRGEYSSTEAAISVSSLYCRKVRRP